LQGQPPFRHPLAPGAVSGALHLGSINNAAIPPSLSGQLSSRLMLGRHQASCQEDEEEGEDEEDDGLAAGWGRQAPMKLQNVSEPLCPPRARQGWLGAPGPALCSPAFTASATVSRGIRIGDLVQKDRTLIYL